MKKQLFVLMVLSLVLGMSCKSQVSNHVLSAKIFQEQIQQHPSAPIVDVRTPEEFSKGHLQNAVNINWNEQGFQSKTEKLDKTKPIFVYCLGGGRSTQAAQQMRSNGFKEVYELEGGMMQWRVANLPETTHQTSNKSGLTTTQWKTLIQSEKIVLVDFYADWCIPCQKMKPYLEEIEQTMKEKVKLIRINADENTQLCKELGIDGLPVLQIYKNNTLTWKNIGYIGKEEVVKNLK